MNAILSAKANMKLANLKNALIVLLAPLSSILFYISFLQNYEDICKPEYETNSSSISSVMWIWCYKHPILLASVLFFLNVNVLFWVIGLILHSHWLIDVYWTVITVLLLHFYKAHPAAKYNTRRSWAAVMMTWIWAIRLSHNYFRRERWQLGVREDWRFTNMAREYGRNWWWVSFFSIYLSQQVFLIGACTPLYLIHSINKPWNFWDSVSVAICMTGVAIAYISDTQLHNFVNRNEKLKEVGEPVLPILEQGLWWYSRHPNYFGEQLWWWGLATFGWNLGFSYAFIGSLINSMCLAYVTVLVEKRMIEQDHRAEAYREYQKTTSVWIPWFKSSAKDGKVKTT